MEGLYSARVTEDRVDTAYVDEDTLRYWGIKGMLDHRDKRSAAQSKAKSRREARVMRKQKALIRDLTALLAAETMIYCTYRFGMAAAVTAIAVCAGAAIWRFAAYAGEESMKVRTPDTQEACILERNGLDPGEYGLTHREETELVLLCYKTRDTITIRQGDKPWESIKVP